MLTSGSIRRPLSFTKDFVSNQNWDNIHIVDTGFDFDVAKGLGIGSNSSSIAVFNFVPARVSSVSAVVSYDSATSQAALDMGVIVRCLTTVVDDTYYYIRFDGSFFKVTRVLDDSFTTLESVAFELAHSTDCTLTVSLTNTGLVAEADDGSTTADFTMADTNIITGSIGFRTLSSSGWIKSITCQDS